MDKWLIVVFVAFCLRPLLGRLMANLSASGGESPRYGTKPTGPWAAVAEETGLQSGQKRKNRPHRLYGTIDGHRLTVTSDHRGPEIEVKFRSGVGSLDIRPIVSNTKTFSSTPPVATGDHLFDSQMHVRSHDAQAAISYLTPLRREIILALHSAVVIDEIDDDEIEVYLPGDEWTPSELAEAIRLTVQVATVLDSSHTVPAMPQDAVIPSSVPQDQARH